MYIFSSFKVAITLAVIGAVVAEFVGSDKGLGYLILTSSGAMKTTVMFGVLVWGFHVLNSVAKGFWLSMPSAALLDGHTGSLLWWSAWARVRRLSGRSPRPESRA